MILLGLTIACGDDGAPGTGGSTGEDGTDTEMAEGTTASPTGGATELATGSSGEAESSSGTGGLPDYSDSPCWGEASSTLVYNGVTHNTDQVPATCRAEGDRVLLYVADELWESTVDQAAVNGLMHRLELLTPEGSVDPGQGVVPNDEMVFGALSEAQFPEGKLAIFVVDTSGGGDGYLCGWCSYPQLHLDGTILQPLDGDYGVSIAAHETFHVIHQAYDGNESQWVDESLAEAAMTANGYFTDTDWLQSFLDQPDQNWGPGGPGLGEFNYGAALLWGTYLWERGSIPLMMAITTEPSDGWTGIDAALDAVGDDRDAWDLYLDMIVATYLDDPALGYGFTSFDFPAVSTEGDLLVGATEMGTLAPYGIDYFPLGDTGELSVGLSSLGPEPVVGQVVVVSGGAAQVQPLGVATPVSVAPGDSAFVALTARDSASYELSLD